MSIVDPHALVKSLCKEPRERGWLEFKSNRFDAEEVGRYISGLANSAILENENTAYLLFGIDDLTHQIVGTDIRLSKKKVGNQVFEHWLMMHMHPQVNIEICGADFDSKHVEIIIIDPAYISPVRFKNEAFVRVDSIQQPLLRYLEKERAIWAITSRFSFEQGVAINHLKPNELEKFFDLDSLFLLLNKNNKNRTSFVDQHLMEELIMDDRQGGFDATNLLALIAARDITSIPLLSNKAPRVIQYRDTTKLHAIEDTTGSRGYGVTFSRLLGFIMGKISSKEEMVKGVRTKTFATPEISVREILANALIHQDFTSQVDGPRVEIFTDKVRVTNPGRPLVSTDRFIDAPPKSRNKKLASLMTRMGLCEQRGSGIDRALDAIEELALPAPTFHEIEGSTVVTMFGPQPFSVMSREDRVRACYQHAALKYENGSMMSNASLRSRLGLSDKQYPQVSIVIRDAIEAKLIRPLDEEQAKRNARYVPAYV